MDTGVPLQGRSSAVLCTELLLPYYLNGLTTSIISFSSNFSCKYAFEQALDTSYLRKADFENDSCSKFVQHTEKYMFEIQYRIQVFHILLDKTSLFFLQIINLGLCSTVIDIYFYSFRYLNLYKGIRINFSIEFLNGN